MDRTPADSNAPFSASLLTLVEAYLFDRPDVLSVEHMTTLALAADELNDPHLTWDGRTGTLLHRACADGRLVWVNALLAHGADAWQLCPEGLPPLAWAAQAHQTATAMRIMMQPGAPSAPPPWASTTLFHTILAQPDTALVEAFLHWWMREGDSFSLPSYDRPDAQGAFPTHLAAQRIERGAETLDRLIELGCSAHAQDRYAMTPFQRLRQTQTLVTLPPKRLKALVPTAANRSQFRRAAVRRRPS